MSGVEGRARVTAWAADPPPAPHFMWDYGIDAEGHEHPRDAGSTSCSAAADWIGHVRQLHVRSTTLVAVSRAPYNTLAAFRERMGRAFPWTALGRPEAGEQPHGRATPIDLHVSGSALRFPDEYGT